jgi:hypothetical protein
MAVHTCKTKRTANRFARRARAKGYNAHAYHVKDGHHNKVSVTRK